MSGRQYDPSPAQTAIFEALTPEARAWLNDALNDACERAATVGPEAPEDAVDLCFRLHDACVADPQWEGQP